MDNYSFFVPYHDTNILFKFKGKNPKAENIFQTYNYCLGKKNINNFYFIPNKSNKYRIFLREYDCDNTFIMHYIRNLI